MTRDEPGAARVPLAPPPATLRGFSPETDGNLILDAWTKQIRPPRRSNRPISVQPFTGMSGDEFQEHRYLIASLLVRCGATLACHPRFPDQVYGWICGETHPTHGGTRQVLHMIYVRSSWRRQGYGRLLMSALFPALGAAPVYFTHQVKAQRASRRAWETVARKWRLIWNPYLITPLVQNESPPENQPDPYPSIIH